MNRSAQQLGEGTSGLGSAAVGAFPNIAALI
jgi:hypothetical protein